MTPQDQGPGYAKTYSGYKGKLSYVGGDHASVQLGWGLRGLQGKGKRGIYAQPCIE